MMNPPDKKPPPAEKLGGRIKSYFVTRASVSRAIISSSFVGMTYTFTVLSAAEMSVSLPRTWFFSWSTWTPRNPETLADALAHIGAVLADAGGERDDINAAHGSRIGADILADLVGKLVESELRALVALFGSLLKIAEVGADAGNAENAGLLVEDVEHLVGGVAVLIHNELENGGVQDCRSGYPSADPQEASGPWRYRRTCRRCSRKRRSRCRDGS